MKSKSSSNKNLGGLDPRVAALATALNKKHGTATITSMRHAPSNAKGYIDSGNPVINVLLSRSSANGFATGRMYELYGGEHVGKSTIAMMTMARCQRALNGIGYVIDSESGWDAQRTMELSVDHAKTLYCDEEFAEYILDEIHTLLIKIGKTPCTIVWDTIAGSTAKALDGVALGRGRRGIHASALSEGLPKLTKLLARSHAVLLMLNQLRNGAIDGNPFTNKRDKESTKGGKAPKFQTAARIIFEYQGDYFRQIKGKHVLFGTIVNIATRKNRFAPNDVRAKLIFQTRGKDGGRFNNALSCLYTLIHWNVIRKQRDAKKFTFNDKAYSVLEWENQYNINRKFRSAVHDALDRSFAHLFLGHSRI